MIHHPARKIAFSFLLCAGIWVAGFSWFILQIPRQSSNDTTPSDAIVVLTGGSGRLEYGLQLLAEGKAKKLFISGVGERFTVEGMLRHAVPDIQKRVSPDAIVLGRQAENTIGNAEETARWLKKEGYKSIRLVTSNYHMPRSVEEFEETAPGVTILPAPVFSTDFSIASWWADEDDRLLLLSEFHKFIASKLRHWVISATRDS